MSDVSVRGHLCAHIVNKPTTNKTKRHTNKTHHPKNKKPQTKHAKKSKQQAKRHTQNNRRTRDVFCGGKCFFVRGGKLFAVLLNYFLNHMFQIFSVCFLNHFCLLNHFEKIITK